MCKHHLISHRDIYCKKFCENCDASMWLVSEKGIVFISNYISSIAHSVSLVNKNVTVLLCSILQDASPFPFIFPFSEPNCVSLVVQFDQNFQHSEPGLNSEQHRYWTEMKIWVMKI